MIKKIATLSALSLAALALSSCTAVIDPDGTMSSPQSTTTTTTTTQDNPYVYGDATTTKKTTTTYR